VVTRRGRWKKVCARGACWALLDGPSTSPLGARVRAFLILAAVFIGFALPAELEVITPTCAQPAELEGHFDGSASISVLLKADTPDSQAVAVALSKKYGFRILWILRAGKGFIASLLTPGEIAKLRCEPDVETISYGQKTTIS
jgi:hypothetical protein